MLAIFQSAGLLPATVEPLPGLQQEASCNNCTCTISCDKDDRPSTISCAGRIWCVGCGAALDIVYDHGADYNEDGFLYDRPDPLLGFGNGMTEMANAGRGSYMGRQLHHQALDRRDRVVLQGSEILSQAAQRLGLSAACRTTAQLLFKELLAGQRKSSTSHEQHDSTICSRRKLLAACLWTALSQFPTEAVLYTRETVVKAMDISSSDLQDGCRLYGLLQRHCHLTAPRIATPQAAQEAALARCQLDETHRAQAVHWLTRAARLVDLLPLQSTGDGALGGAWAGLMALGGVVYGWPLDIARCAQIAGVTVQTAHRHYLSYVKRLPELLLEAGTKAP